MRTSPLEALFEHLFYGFMDVAYLILNILMLRVINDTRWKAHLRWIIPSLLSCGLTVIQRTILNTHYLMGLSLPDRLYISGRICNYAADVIGLYGAIILLKTLRQMVNGTLPEATHSPPQTLPEHGTWPPPPTAPR